MSRLFSNREGSADHLIKPRRTALALDPVFHHINYVMSDECKAWTATSESVGMQPFQRSDTSHRLSSSFVCGCWCCVYACDDIQRRGGGVGGAAVTVYQYSKRTLSETTTAPVGPSARRPLFMDAEHAFRRPSASPSAIFSCTNTNPCHTAPRTCQPQLLRRMKCLDVDEGSF